MDKNNERVEQVASGPKGLMATLSGWQQALTGVASVGALAIAGWLGSGLILGPQQEIGDAGGNSPRATIRDCEASWLTQKIDVLKMRCHHGNIEILKVSEDEVYRQYEAMAMQWPKVFLNTSAPITPKEIQEFMWPEEGFFRRTVNGLSGTDELRSLVTAQGFYLGRMKEISAHIHGLQARIDRHKAYAEKERARQPEPYSILAAPAPSTIAVAVLGKSGPFNIYDIQPKDDLDALKYFSGSTVYQPEELAKLLPVIEKATAEHYGLTCEYLCADAQGNVVGRTRVYIDDHPGQVAPATR